MCINKKKSYIHVIATTVTSYKENKMAATATAPSKAILSNYTSNQITLCDWIGKVKVKKRQLRRCRRTHNDLRIAAVLTTALQRAEEEMRRKQQDRAVKWAQLNIQIRQSTMAEQQQRQQQMELESAAQQAEEEKKRREIDELWMTELNGLDKFINNMNQIKTTVVR